MCGIVGVAERDPRRPVAPTTLEEMCDAIRHRGPDGRGMLLEPGVGLGMQRLSIIDLAGGQQPIWNEDETLAIVFNGEIYNYRALRSELASRGHHFRSQSDTETVLHLYEELGTGVAERLRGMFAFAIWDRHRRALFLGRDRFGIKPLYYALAEDRIAFASELKALLAGGFTERELDWEALDQYFQLGYIPAPATPFRDVRKLEPGHWLLWDSHGARIERYWDLPAEPVEAPVDPERRLREWLDDSVRAHMVSDVPVAAFLSGGLDSSAVVSSLALEGGAASSHAFTAHYRGSGAAAADETPLARKLTDQYGVPLTVVEVAPDVRDLLEPIVSALDEPHADDSAIPTWLLSHAVAQSYKVVLSGAGGDELFAGYRRHIGLMAAGRYGRLPRRLRQSLAGVVRHVPDLRNGLAIDRLKRFLAGGDGDTAERYLALVRRLEPLTRLALYTDRLRSEAADPTLRRFEEIHRDGGRPEGLTAALYFDYKTFLADDVLALSDRLGMAHSLEIRVPFVDHPLVEHVFPLPDDLKIGRWTPKQLLRRALQHRLPAAHFRAPKRGFVGPTTSWLRNELRPMLQDELSADRIARLGHFDPKVVAQLMDDHLSGRQNREGILWALLCFSTWHRLMVEPGTGSHAGGRRRPAEARAGRVA
ncbi:MAG: asparagine synthase (glutamine-hydrolyzing) [Gemmatimonadales bacterium]